MNAFIKFVGIFSIGTNNLSSIKYLSNNFPSEVKTRVVRDGL